VVQRPPARHADPRRARARRRAASSLSSCVGGESRWSGCRAPIAAWRRRRASACCS
jgi:hypothetical protein